MFRWVPAVVLGALTVCTASAANLAVADPTSPETRRITKSVIRWEIRPAQVVVFLDGRKLGQAKDLTATPTEPGRHVIRLVKGDDETEMEIEVQKGQILRFVLDFSE